jgi:hypothetical protein
VVADALRRLDTEMSHLTFNSDAIPELFENSNDKSIAKHQEKDTTPV